MARSKVWTVDLDDATNDWYKCRRQKGQNSHTACLEAGEALRRAHWKHQLEIQESGCEKPFIGCIRRAGVMNLMPQTPLELRRPERYSGAWWLDFGKYRAWNKRKDKFLEEHPDWW